MAADVPTTTGTPKRWAVPKSTMVATRSGATPRSSAVSTYPWPKQSMNASMRGAASRSRSARPSPYSTGWIPRSRRVWALDGPAIPMTSAPVRRASWDARMPTPPAAADTATVSPGWGATVSTVAWAVVAAT